jgi:hypothetical protein
MHESSRFRIIDECSLSDVKIYSVTEYKDLNENFDPKSFSPILGIVEGKSLVLDGVSRNGRFYPKELWNNALKREETKQLLKDKLMFGCVGHPENYTLDELLSDGKVSHIVSKIEIRNDGYGYATYEILDTPAGRILFTVLKAGSKMKVSTRGFGEFANESKNMNGKNYQVINPNTFTIESIDFVIHPGIADVDVSLIETLIKDNKEDLDKLKESKIQICEDGICTILEGIEVHEHYKTEISKYKKIISNLNEENIVLQDKILEEVVDNKDNSEVSTEKDEFEQPLELLNAYLEHYLKQIHSVKAHEERTKKLIEWINTPNDNLTEEDFNGILETVKVFNDDYVDKVVKLINWIKEKSKKDFEDNTEDESNKVNSKEIMDIIKDGNEKLIQNVNGKKDKEVKEAKEKVSKDLSEEYNDLIRDLTKKITLQHKNEEDFKSINKKLTKSISDNILKEKLLDDKKKEIILLTESLNKSISESNDSINILKNESKILKEKNIFLEDEIKNKNFEIVKERDLKKHLVNESVQEKLKENEESFKLKFEETLIKNKKSIENLKKEIITLEESVRIKEIEKNKSEEIKESNYSLEVKKVEELKKSNTIYVEENKSLKEENEYLEKSKKTLESEFNETKILYLQSLYKLDKTIITETLNTFNNMKMVKESLEKRELKNSNFNEDFGLDLNIKQERKKVVTLAERLI